MLDNGLWVCVHVCERVCPCTQRPQHAAPSEQPKVWSRDLHHATSYSWYSLSSANIRAVWFLNRQKEKSWQHHVRSLHGKTTICSFAASALPQLFSSTILPPAFSSISLHCSSMSSTAIFIVCKLWLLGEPILCFHIGQCGNPIGLQLSHWMHTMSFTHSLCICYTFLFFVFLGGKTVNASHCLTLSLKFCAVFLSCWNTDVFSVNYILCILSSLLNYSLYCQNVKP